VGNVTKDTFRLSHPSTADIQPRQNMLSESTPLPHNKQALDEGHWSFQDGLENAQRRCCLKVATSTRAV